MMLCQARLNHLGPAWLRGKWERKENGEGKGDKGDHFPLLGRRENGRGKKMGKENSVGPMPHFPPNFFLQKWGIMGQICYPTLCPYHILIVPLLHSSPNSILHCISPFLSCFLSIHNTRASLISPFLLIILSNQLSCSLSFSCV